MIDYSFKEKIFRYNYSNKVFMKHLIYANQINNHKLEIRKKLCDANDVEKMLIPPFFLLIFQLFLFNTE